MPYTIQKRGSKWALVRTDGTVKQTSTSKKKAEAARRLLMGLEDGWTPRGRK